VFADLNTTGEHTHTHTHTAESTKDVNVTKKMFTMKIKLI